MIFFVNVNVIIFYSHGDFVKVHRDWESSSVAVSPSLALSVPLSPISLETQWSVKYWGLSQRGGWREAMTGGGPGPAQL